jgi:N utilization substance protein A
VQTFVSRALSPAKITQVRPDIETKTVTVVVEEDQLSLAIGKEGQNVRLASRLTGWQIELVSSRELEQRQRLQEHLLMPIEEMVGVSDKMAEKLREAGINTVQKLLKTPAEKLAAIPGFGERTIEKLMETANGTVKELQKALEELIRKENEDREEKKRQEKPLFDESMLEAETEEPKREKKLTAAMLFRDPAEVEEETPAETKAEATTEIATAEEAPAESSAETPSENATESDVEAEDKKD